MSEINLILFYGITFGILIMTIVYTFIRYLYSKEIFYISYCFMQIFSFVYILSYSKLFPISPFIQEIALIIASLSAVLFAINYYEGKFLPKITNYKELIICWDAWTWPPKRINTWPVEELKSILIKLYHKWPNVL